MENRPTDLGDCFRFRLAIAAAGYGGRRRPAFPSSAAEHQREVIGRHVDDFLQFQAVVGGGFFQVGDVLQTPFRHLVRRQRGVEFLVRCGGKAALDFERSVNQQNAVRAEQMGRAFHHAVGDRNRRDLENVDAKNSVEAAFVAGVEPSVRVGQIQMHRVGNVVVAVVGGQLADVVEHFLVLVARVEVQMVEMRREKVDVHAAAAGHFQHPSRILGQFFFQHAQDRLAVAVAGPGHVFAKRVRVQWRFVLAHGDFLVSFFHYGYAVYPGLNGMR